MHTTALWGLAAGLALLLFASHAHAGHLCQAGERLLFSCKLKRKKGTRFASLCQAKKTITYRYGDKKKVQLAVSHPKVPFWSRSEMYSGGYGSFVTFEHKGRTYSVYQKLVKVTIAKKARIAGIEILTSKNKTLDLRCDPKTVKGDVTKAPVPKKKK